MQDNSISSRLVENARVALKGMNIPRKSVIVVAVSGGPDSVCLLDVLVCLAGEFDIKLHIAHLNHQLRGEDAEGDARYVAALAATMNIPVTIEKRDVSGAQQREHLSMEEAARLVRYEFLAEVVNAVGAWAVATGHTLDDHLETVLMHIIRGSGTRGLAGLKPEALLPAGTTRLRVIRPLLAVSRYETKTWCTLHDLKPRLDSSNLSLKLFRNRIRHRLLPKLKTYNPLISDALLRLSNIAAEDIDYIDRETQKHWGEIVSIESGCVFLDRDRLCSAHTAIQRNLLRMAIEAKLGTLRDIEARHIDSLVAALDKPAGKQVHLPFGLIFYTDYTRFIIGFEEELPRPFPELPEEMPLAIPGITAIAAWSFEATVLDMPVDFTDSDGYTAYLDFAKTGEILTVRSRRTGDRFYPLGLKGIKKLGEFMIDAGIPRAWRDSIPLVCSREQIVWLAGWRIDDRIKVTESTTTVLRIRMIGAKKPEP